MATLYLQTDYQQSYSNATLTVAICFIALICLAVMAWRAYKFKIGRQKFEVSLFNQIYNEIVKADPEFHKRKDNF